MAEISRTSRFPFPEFPNGWFQIANRADLVPGHPLRQAYLGHSLSLILDDQGGLSLDVETLNGEAVRPWPLDERCGLIFVYHHDEASAPSWDLPSLETFAEPGWTPMKTTRLEIRSHPQEICENTADVAHLAAVHGMQVGDRDSIVVETKGPLMRIGVSIKIASRPDSANADVEIFMWTENYGPALGVVHLANPDGTETFSTYAPTPRGDGLLDYRISTALRRPGTTEQISRALEHSHRYQCATVLEDVPIWENKTFHARPRLSEVDGPIPRFRDWYSQYYSPPAN
jgi:phenylpropionate dioxygenase-like ring-hydroxylating dioxygenase large terminal subunit